MSPVHYVETHIRDSQCRDEDLTISSVRRGTILENDTFDFTLGLHDINHQKKIRVKGDGKIEVRLFPFRNIIDHFLITQNDGTVTITETKNGQKLELTYEPPINR
jgi:hypothetical protein